MLMLRDVPSSGGPPGACEDGPAECGANAGNRRWTIISEQLRPTAVATGVLDSGVLTTGTT